MHCPSAFWIFQSHWSDVASDDEDAIEDDDDAENADGHKFHMRLQRSLPTQQPLAKYIYK